MMPNSILPSGYIYQYEEPSDKPVKSEYVYEDPVPVNKMVKEILDSDGNVLKDVSYSPLKNDPEDKRRIVRHTRAYYKKLASAQKQQEASN